MFSKLTSSSGRSPTLQSSPNSLGSGGASASGGSPNLPTSQIPSSSSSGSATSSAGGDAVETRFFSHSDIKKIESGESKLDTILRNFLQCFERHKYDDSGAELFGSFSAMLEFKKHFSEMLEKYPELSTSAISSDLNKLLALLSDRDENVIEPAFHLLSELHTSLHERIFMLTGSDSCKIENRRMRTQNDRMAAEMSHANLSLEEIRKQHEEARNSMPITTAEQVLLKTGERGVFKAFEAGEMFSKYFRDCLSYVEKKLALDLDYCVKLYKISQTYCFAAVEENFATLPLWGTVSFMNLQDKEYCKKMNETCMELQNRRLLDSLRVRKQEFDDLKKEIRDLWDMEERQYANTCLLLKKARDNYWTKQAEVSRLESTDSEKKTKHVIEARDRLLDAKIKYDKLIEVANAAQRSVREERNTAVVCIRQLVLQAELKIQSAFVNYFKSITGIYQLRPVQYKILVEQSRNYCVGSFYKDQLINTVFNDTELPTQNEEEFKPQSCPNINLKQSESKASRLFSISSTAMTSVISSKSKSTDEGLQKRTSNLSTMLTVPSPYYDRHSSISELSISDASKTHSFLEAERDSSQSAFCLECEVYVFYEALICRSCFRTVHTCCLENLSISCSQAKERSPRQLKIFTNELSQQPRDASNIPLILSRSVKQIEGEFIDIRGLYRTEGARAKVQNLCQAFEDNPSEADLSNSPPQVICSMVKHFFRVLPNRLLDSSLTEDWQDIGRCYRTLKDEEKPFDHLILKSVKLLAMLKRPYYESLKFFMAHLDRVSRHSGVNKMNAYNLGRVFGPTLIGNRTTDQYGSGGRLEQEVSDLDFQSAVIEMFIENYPGVFEGGQKVPVGARLSGGTHPELSLSRSSDPDIQSRFGGGGGGGNPEAVAKRSLQSLSKMHGAVSMEQQSGSETSTPVDDSNKLNKFETTQSMELHAKQIPVKQSTSSPDLPKE